jgi:hypothetical protein
MILRIFIRHLSYDFSESPSESENCQVFCHCEGAKHPKQSPLSKGDCFAALRAATQKLTVIASAPKGREAISVQVRDCFVGLLRRPPRNDNKVSGFTHIAARRYGVLAMTVDSHAFAKVGPLSHHSYYILPVAQHDLRRHVYHGKCKS